MSSQPRKQKSSVRLGFVPLCDSAPLAVAMEMGIFERYGLKVSLSRELGWASVRDKIFYETLDAAESIAGIAFSLGFGIDTPRSEVAVSLVLNLHGNAITLSNDIRPIDIGKGEGLASYLMHSWKKDRPFTLAVTHRFSSHHFLIHQWLKRHGVLSKVHVEIITIPPPLMPRHLKAGHIDGYCVGEPWNSESILSGIGWCPATSADISFSHPEKVLLLSGKFVHERRNDAIALTASLIEACKKCQDPDFREELISILALKAYTGASEEVLRNSLGSHFNTGIEFIDATSFHAFHGKSVNRPTIDKASWVLSGLRETNTVADITTSSLSRIYRDDLYQPASQYTESSMNHLHHSDEIASLK
ncbi:MAG: ABC transporter substrate-binding protein [Akkermansiaceae bacterium]|nr:ABC transporter substrate-binding protein [Akkermansiaceae bacterium]